MNSIIISDLHGNLIDLPKCELLMICGDICPSNDHSFKFQKEWLYNTFSQWIKNLQCEHVILVPGNHDFFFEGSTNLEIYNLTASLNHKLTVLINQEYNYISNEGRVYKIFGTPYCKLFGNWAFMKDNYQLKELYSLIPENLDILLTHDAPRIAELGCIREEGNMWYGNDAGNEVLASIIIEKTPKYSFCGHIHSGNHDISLIGLTNYANVSICNEKYQPVNKPLIIDII